VDDGQTMEEDHHMDGDHPMHDDGGS